MEFAKIDIRNSDIPPLSQIFKFLISGLIGLIIGIFSSAIVNSTMVEITRNAFFAIYFGLIFIIIGVLIALRISSIQSSKKKLLLILFASLIIISGLISLSLLEHQWYRRFNPISKIPVYIILGVSLNFAIIFGVVDVINYFIGLFQNNRDKSIVESHIQIVWVLINSLIMGWIYGLIFGLMDVEDAGRWEFQGKLLIEEKICMPIAGLLGFFGGFINEYLRIRVK